MSTANNIPNNVLVRQETPNQVLINQPPENKVLVRQDTPNQVIINNESQNMVTVRAGTFASAPTRRHVHSQDSPSSTWTINHELGGKPSVTVVDTGDNVVHGDVQYISSTQVICSFSAPFAGFAYLT